LSHETFLLPDVGEGLTEAEIVTWKVTVGDNVVLNQPLVDIETAKAVVELPSPYAGIVVTLHVKAGDVIEVHKPLITFDVGGEASAVAPTATVEESRSSEAAVGAGREAVLIGYGVAHEEAVVTRQHRRASSTASRTPLPASPLPSSAPTMAARSTPPVRLYAKQHGVELATLAGSGRDGLIDLAIGGVGGQMKKVRLSGPTETSRFVGRDLEPWATGPLEERIAIKGVLRSMADAMVQSAFSAPHAAVWLRVDATKTVELLASLKSRENLSGTRLSPLTIVALAVCDAARHFPGINSSFDAVAGEVIVRRSVNLGIAANTPRGLIVPNIKGADQLDLVAMAIALTALVDTAREGTTQPSEMSGTTLTVTNVGPFGVDGAIPILPPGTGAIVCVGQIAKAPWVVNDEVVVRHVVEISMAFDHRQIDGAMASAVLAHVGHFLRDPAAAIIAG
jgi:2-oxoisovalerate dehydrogenase E2 component (dihydrolipoyl transacylase)